MEELKTNETYAWAISDFTNDEIEKIKNLNTNKQQATIELNNIDYKVRDSKITWLQTDDENNWIYQRLIPIIQYVNYKYFQFILDKIEPLQLTEYDKSYNGFYSKHIDIGYDNNMRRKLSFVMFLSDESEYEGGELLLYISEKPTKPEQKKGNIVFFPSYVLHEVTPVINGTRNTLVGWVEGPRFR